MGKRLSVILLALLLVLSAPAAYAETDSTQPTEPTDYVGPLDPVTGLPPTGEEKLPEISDVVQLQEGVYGFNRETGKYINYVGDLSFISNYPPNSILSSGNAMSISLPGGMTSVLYYNGTQVTSPDLGSISQIGSYVLEVYSGSSTVQFSFRILGELTNAVSEISLPKGFRFAYLKLNGEEYSSEFADHLELLEEGEYELCWACEQIDSRYVLKFKRDTVAPTVQLPQVVNGKAAEPVTLEGLEAGCYAVLTDEEGKQTVYKASGATISEPGKYTLTVYDPAGNSTSYSFSLQVYLNLGAGMAIAMVAALILALYLYGRYVRKHPRVG